MAGEKFEQSDSPMAAFKSGFALQVGKLLMSAADIGAAKGPMENLGPAMSVLSSSIGTPEIVNQSA